MARFKAFAEDRRPRLSTVFPNFVTPARPRGREGLSRPLLFTEEISTGRWNRYRGKWDDWIGHRGCLVKAGGLRRHERLRRRWSSVIYVDIEVFVDYGDDNLSPNTRITCSVMQFGSLFWITFYGERVNTLNFVRLQFTIFLKSKSSVEKSNLRKRSRRHLELHYISGFTHVRVIQCSIRETWIIEDYRCVTSRIR